MVYCLVFWCCVADCVALSTEQVAEYRGSVLDLVAQLRSGDDWDQSSLSVRSMLECLSPLNPALRVSLKDSRLGATPFLKGVEFLCSTEHGVTMERLIVVFGRMRSRMGSDSAGSVGSAVLAAPRLVDVSPEIWSALVALDRTDMVCLRERVVVLMLGYFFLVGLYGCEVDKWIGDVVDDAISFVGCILGSVDGARRGDCVSPVWNVFGRRSMEVKAMESIRRATLSLTQWRIYAENECWLVAEGKSVDLDPFGVCTA